MQQVDHRSERRGLRADGSGPLPQFDLKSWDSFDPDQTLERLPVLSNPVAPPPPARPVVAVRPAAPAVAPASVAVPVRTMPPVRQLVSYDQDPDTDLAATIEIVPEISVSDILEDEPARPAPPPRPPLVLPAPVSVPLDLDRLLARARAEASRSPEYFHTPTPPPPSSGSVVGQADAFLLETPRAPRAGRSDPTLALPAMVHRRRRRVGVVAGTVTAFLVTAVSVGIAVGQSSVSTTRSPASVTVTKPAQSAAFASTAPVSASVTGPVTGSLTAGPVTPKPGAAIPAISVQSLPRVESGTISLAAVAASHRLFVDGRVIESGSAIVSCGSHIVQVGSRGQRKYVNVPCGQEIVLAN